MLAEYLRQHGSEISKVLTDVSYSVEDIQNWRIIEYPDELLYKLKKEVNKEYSLLLYELLHLENPGQIRKINSDYALIKAFESEASYLFIGKNYRKKQSKLVTDLLLEKNIFELDLGPLARYNLFGKHIYESFLKSAGKGEEYNRIASYVPLYFVYAHDQEGSLFCHREKYRDPL